MDEIKKLMETIVAMIYAAYGPTGVKILHTYLDVSHPGTGAANNNRKRRDVRHPGTRANNLLYLCVYIRDNGGREIHWSELMQKLKYKNKSHLQADLRELRAKGDIVMGTKGYYRWVEEVAA